jgi:hypothetical protein
MDVLKERHLPFGISHSRVRQALEIVRDVLDEKWLNGKKWHPVRQLWRSNDWLSTVELLWLGESLQVLRGVDHDWLEHHVRALKRPDKSDRVGSQFEILGLAALTAPDQVLVPAAQAMPAYDADLNVRGKPLRLSLKNFGALERQHIFERRAAAIEESILSWAQVHGHSWVGLLVVASTYPTEEDWRVLRSALPAFLTAGLPLLETAVWRVVRHNPGLDIGELDQNRTSCNITILATQHRNERWAFLSRMQREFGSFNAAAAAWDDREKAVLIRLAERAPLGEACRAAEEFLERSDTNVDSVILYQPSVASNRAAGITMLTHHIVTVQRGLVRAMPTFRFPIGPVTTEPTRPELRVDKRVIQLYNYHVHQRNAIYRIAELTAEGGLEGVITSRAPGHTEHVTYRTEYGSITYSPRDVPRSEMLLFA